MWRVTGPAFGDMLSRQSRAERLRQSVVTRVDDAEAVAFGVGQHHEVGIDGIVPTHASRSEPEKPFDLRGLFGRVVDHEIEMHSRPLLGPA